MATNAAAALLIFPTSAATHCGQVHRRRRWKRRLGRAQRHPSSRWRATWQSPTECQLHLIHPDRGDSARRPTPWRFSPVRGDGTLPRMHAAPPTSSRGLTRFVPILDWSRTLRPPVAPRRPARGHRGRGDDRAQGPRLCEHRRQSRSRTGCTPRRRPRSSTASSARPDTSRPGPSSSLAAVAGGAVLLTGLSGNDAAQLVAAIAVADRCPVPAGRHPQARLACQLPLAGGRDRVPRGRRDRRGHRRAAQAHGNLHRRCERVAGARVVGSGPGRSQPADAAWSGWLPLPSSSRFVSRFRGSRVRSSSWSAA